MENQFDPHLYTKVITIVGVGGTGAQVARIVGRILYDMQRARMHTPSILLIDPDRVEPKNVGRQLFPASAIGTYKAEHVGKMLNLTLGLDVHWIPEPVDAEKHFDRYSNLIISCVDNHLARREISKIPGVLIGAGNDKAFGQVCIGNCNDREVLLKGLDPADGKFHYLPAEGLLFPQLLEPEPEPQPAPISCIDAVISADQELLVNDWMGCIIGQYIYKILHRQPVKTFASFLNCEEIGVRSLPICKEEILARLQ